jgi:hypothetical protein
MNTLVEKPISSTMMGAPEIKTVTPGLRIAWWLSTLIIPLAGIAAAGGLWIPDLYRNPAAIIPALQGQDLVTLLVLPLLALALLKAVRGSSRGTIVWLGLLGYLCYTYTGAAFAYYFNRFTLLYIALFSLSIFALVAAISGIDVRVLEQSFDTATPRKSVALFLILVALMLSGLEVGQNLHFLRTGEIPAGVVVAGNSTYFVYVLDLGLVVPLCLLAAMWILRAHQWGALLAGIMLSKAAAMGLALLAMDGFIRAAGQRSDGLELLWTVIAIGGVGLAGWLVGHCHDQV